MKKYKIGYTAGVYDMFHIGHLNVLMNAKQYCEHLIVAVSTDEVVRANKHKAPIIKYEDRIRIVEAIRYVDEVVPQTDYNDKITAAKKYGIDVMFVGDDWKGSEKWARIEEQLKDIGVDLVYLPYTHSVSSTILRDKIRGQ
ncbi:adenylyltransferase/cytidyltransferase family protein [Aristaeella hokkaidonensis]|uniref:Adenylyltransferase/cytidyltransferase family protein n=1 Tax=Aristaeella hokkaidonensis TaxID=3046382 RepID=A0AC61MYK0_9FIRM|nr:adenylyltransferase/cytidyltransferase family protein [Aristaeella hokkaidonensis]QUC68215.1 adenylyltransferase/cytidyltransferase family protein [Aristaeella hokkaidonensis]